MQNMQILTILFMMAIAYKMKARFSLNSHQPTVNPTPLPTSTSLSSKTLKQDPQARPSSKTLKQDPQARSSKTSSKILKQDPSTQDSHQATWSVKLSSPPSPSFSAWSPQTQI
ncbi:MAG: hypothetical protein J3R72DRAFT_499306 [Linnemannia gamsii]|nr:MAG: hypothetical protein J3R72DRAFT_499306 [Linnemannia gamsii]